MSYQRTYIRTDEQSSALPTLILLRFFYECYIIPILKSLYFVFFTFLEIFSASLFVVFQDKRTYKSFLILQSTSAKFSSNLSSIIRENSLKAELAFSLRCPTGVDTGFFQGGGQKISVRYIFSSEQFCAPPPGPPLKQFYEGQSQIFLKINFQGKLYVFQTCF